MFAFDLATRTVVWSVEVVGQGQVTSLAVTPGGQVWAATQPDLQVLADTIRPEQPGWGGS